MAHALQRLAAEARSYFETAARADGSAFWRHKAGTPEWITDMVRAAHLVDGSSLMLPNDLRYEYIVEALDALVEWEDNPCEIHLEGDVYTHDLTTWLDSHGLRTFYADEAKKQGYWDGEEGIEALLRYGQEKEKEEILYSLITTLSERLEAAAEDDDEEENEGA